MDFYTGIIEWSDDDRTSFLCNVWAWASHIGEAVHKMLACAKETNINNPLLVEIDFFNFEDLPETSVTNDNGNTFIDDEEFSFLTENCYKLPHGVIYSSEEHECEPADIKTGYEIVEDEGLIQIEAVVNEKSLLDIYLELISVLPTIIVFWIKIQSDWEESDNEEIYTNEELNSLRKINDYLPENKIDTLLNGHLTLTTYSDKGQTNLSISDHKIIVVMTRDKEICDGVSKTLERHGISKKEDLISVARGFQHWHYRHPKGLDRRNLIEKLKTQGFNLWQPAEE